MIAKSLLKTSIITYCQLSCEGTEVQVKHFVLFCQVLMTGRHSRFSPLKFRLLLASFVYSRYVVRVYWFEHVTSSRTELLSHLNMLIQQHSDSSCHSTQDRDLSGSFGAEGEEYVMKDALLAENSFEVTPLHHLLTDSSSHGDCSLHDKSKEGRLEKPRGKLKVRLQTYPRSFAEFLAEELTGIDCQLHNFSQSLYALEVDGKYRYGLSSGADMYLAPCDREDLAKDYIARAALKLEEVTQVCGFKLNKDMIAMDLGASPGAWTQFLSKHIQRVVAVDPAELNGQVLQQNVTHIRKLAQDATEELVAWSEGKGYDLLVCDVNRHPVEAAKLVSPLLPYLKEGGLLVLTLKFHGRGRDKEQKVDEIKGIFRKVLIKTDCIWLLANSIYERTFVGIKGNQ
ncbi:hypothetical protein MPTK1_6g13900 [Marchantia polymorpha subsp. ruderalis]|uniref:Ribosomal RNA methyltransferase FtsJ domain-containing protein n=2 Tax=Marchantia polymorpha TaxID=3197 RepID=A0AAF6BRT6_MARPO|nr:hypothetical protein MARPO_0047s0042 [Marchantia polymorpha]BBN14720.1 hypothetical protein Mp_6g13900 [Marchantia polymorpha subsp. ruderalis]|eukprot:PTQ39059.1 hypothetical protein MARPO_0047s0042 [Marchantia polymorpha]